MLNYVWIALIILGIGTAVWIDVSDNINNKYNNSISIPAEIRLSENFQNEVSKTYDAKLIISKEVFKKYYNENVNEDIIQPARLTYDRNEKTTTVFIKTTDGSPEIWQEMAEVNGKEDDLTATLVIRNFEKDSTASASIIFEDVSFVRMKDVTNSSLSYASTAVQIAIGLIGIMALWLGMMKIAEEAGIVKIIANALKPITKFLFPDVPSDHPAMGAMIMNISANMLGLSNAATPFGLKAMEELDKLNPNKGTATNAMVTFLVVNTAGFQLISATAIAVRAAAGSANPAIIIGTVIFGSACSTIVGIIAAKLLEKFPIQRGELGNWFKENMRGFIFLLVFVVSIAVLVLTGLGASLFSLLNFINPAFIKNLVQIIAILAIPAIITTFIIYGLIKKVKIYEKFVEGAKEGFNVAVRIIPYLVGILVAIGIFRAGGAMELLIMILKPVTDLIGMPAEALPMALMRPLSGSGSLGIMTEIMSTHGADSFIGILVSTFYGSTETTFYVLAVYFGSINIVRTRHALPAGLLADTAGMLAALFIVKQLFG